MDRRYRPTLIILQKHLPSKTPNTKENDAGCSMEHQHPAFYLKESTNLLKNTQVSISSRNMQLDLEISNDFQWLINLDLRAYLRDIDSTDNPPKKARGIYRKFAKNTFGSGFVNLIEKGNNQRAKKDRSTNIFLRRKLLSQPYSEIITRCLNENGELCVKDIYSWISHKFPGVKSSHISWKSAIRHSLSVNPLFKKRKVPARKNHVWCLNEAASTAENEKSEVISSKVQPDLSDVKCNTDNCFVTRNEGFTSNTELLLNNRDVSLASTLKSDDQNDENDPYNQTWLTENSEGADLSLSQPEVKVRVLKNEPSNYYELEIPSEAKHLTGADTYTEAAEVMQYRYQ